MLTGTPRMCRTLDGRAHPHTQLTCSTMLSSAVHRSAYSAQVCERCWMRPAADGSGRAVMHDTALHIVHDSFASVASHRLFIRVTWCVDSPRDQAVGSTRRL